MTVALRLGSWQTSTRVTGYCARALLFTVHPPNDSTNYLLPRPREGEEAAARWQSDDTILSLAVSSSRALVRAPAFAGSGGDRGAVDNVVVRSAATRARAETRTDEARFAASRRRTPTIDHGRNDDDGDGGADEHKGALSTDRRRIDQRQRGGGGSEGRGARRRRDGRRRGRTETKEATNERACVDGCFWSFGAKR